MTKYDKKQMCSKELRELSEMFQGVKDLPEIPQALLNLMHEKAKFLSEQFLLLNEVLAQPSEALEVDAVQLADALPLWGASLPASHLACAESEIPEELSHEEESNQEEKEEVAEPLAQEEQEVGGFFEASDRSHSNQITISAHALDFRRLMTLNDRFVFQKQLFHGDVGTLNYTIDQINGCATLEEALIFLKGQYQWDSENETVLLFNELLTKHFHQV